MKSITIISALAILLAATCCFADTVTVKAGDVLTCDVLTEYVGLSTPYQNLFFKNDFIADITCDPAKSGQCTITTINNDAFTGKLINSALEAVMNTGSKISLPADTIRKAHLDSPGDTQEQGATVFAMKNGDVFSGKMLTGKLNIDTEKLSLSVDAKNMKRIAFIKPGTKWAEIYLNDGSMLAGEISEDVISIAPDSTPNINICITQFQSIQLNAVKYIKKAITPQDYTDPQTGKPAFLKMFPGVSPDITDGGKICPMSAKPEKALDVNENLKVSIVLFDTNKSDIKPVYIELLNRLAEELKNNQTMTVYIKGYTDNVASAPYNQALSLRRAYSVARFLEDAGVNNKRISISGYGLAQPVANNKTEEGRTQNRRVEIELLP